MRGTGNGLIQTRRRRRRRTLRDSGTFSKIAQALSSAAHTSTAAEIAVTAPSSCISPAHAWCREEVFEQVKGWHGGEAQISAWLRLRFSSSMACRNVKCAPAPACGFALALALALAFALALALPSPGSGSGSGVPVFICVFPSSGPFCVTCGLPCILCLPRTKWLE